MTSTEPVPRGPRIHVRIALGICAFVACTVISVLAVSRDEIAVLLAFVNIALAALLLVAAFRRGIVRGLAALTFLPLLLLSWSATTVYFAIAFPEAEYTTNKGSFPCLGGASQLQIVTLVLLLGYGIGLLLTPAVRLRRRGINADSHEDSTSEVCLIGLALVSITIGWATGLSRASGASWLVGNALRNYFTGFVFIAGYRWHRLGGPLRLATLAALGASLTVNTVANARGLALMPILLLALGYILRPETSKKARWSLIASAGLLFPIYSVVGNQTRIAINSIGFENFESRASILVDSLSGNLHYEEGGFLRDTFVRLFSTGGHALVTSNWDTASLDQTDWKEFATEATGAFLPAFVSSPKESPQYSGSQVLREYGFNINDKTSVEVSLPGSLYATGGAFFVFLGALLIGCIQSMLFGVFGGKQRPGGLVLARASALFAVNIVVCTLDIITALHVYLWTTLYATLAWVGCRTLSRALAAQGARRVMRRAS